MDEFRSGPGSTYSSHLLFLLFQHLIDLLLQVFAPEIFSHNTVFTIEDKGAGDSLHAIRGSNLRLSAFQVRHVFPIAAILTDCRQPSLPVIINGNTDDLQPLRAITLIDLYQVHVLCPAGTTPRSPKINDFHFSFRLVQ